MDSEMRETQQMAWVLFFGLQESNLLMVLVSTANTGPIGMALDSYSMCHPDKASCPYAMCHPERSASSRSRRICSSRCLLDPTNRKSFDSGSDSGSRDKSARTFAQDDTRCTKQGSGSVNTTLVRSVPNLDTSYQRILGAVTPALSATRQARLPSGPCPPDNSRW